MCEKYRAKVRLFDKIVNSITNEMRHVKYFIEHIVDFSGRRSENRFIVRANVDSHLDKREKNLHFPGHWFNFYTQIITFS